MPKRIARVVVITLFALLVIGCARPGGPPTIDRYKPLIHMAVSIATDRLLTQQPDLAPLVFQVSSILVDTFDGGDFTSVAQVAAFVRTKIPWDKIGEDMRPLIEALLVGIGEELRVLVNQHQIPETQAVLFIKELMGWVKDAAQRHMAVPVRVQRVQAPPARIGR